MDVERQNFTHPLSPLVSFQLHTGRLPLVARGASSSSSGEKGKTTESATPKGPSKAASSKGTAKTTGAASAKTTGAAKTAEASKPKTPPEVVKSPGLYSCCFRWTNFSSLWGGGGGGGGGAEIKNRRTEE